MDFPSVPLDDALDLGLGIVAQSGCKNLSHIADLEQGVDTSEFFQFTLVKNGDTVAHILYIGQQITTNRWLQRKDDRESAEAKEDKARKKKKKPRQDGAKQ